MSALNKPIEMISLCGTEGEIRPLRFRFEGMDQQLHTVKISEIVDTKQIMYGGSPSFQYLCKAIFGDREILFELKYAVKDHRWILFRYIS